MEDRQGMINDWLYQEELQIDKERMERKSISDFEYTYIYVTLIIILVSHYIT
jgi:hypothetical protein